MAGATAGSYRQTAWSKKAMRWNWGWNDTQKVWMNWHNTQIVNPAYYYFPTSLEKLREIILQAKKEGRGLKPVGMGCSPNSISVSNEGMIFMDCLNKLIEIDEVRCTAKVQAGMTIKQLNEEISQRNLALPVMTSISEQSIGGAIACAIHGTGANYGSFSSYVLSLQLLSSDGEIFECSADANADIFKAALCNLGALGVIVEVKLQLERRKKIRAVQQEAPLSELLNIFPKRLQENEHWRFWYFPHTEMCVEWFANRIPDVDIKMKKSAFSLWKLLDFSSISNFLLETAYLIGAYIPVIGKLSNQLYRWIFYSSRVEVVGYSEEIFNFNCLFRQYVNEWNIPQRNCEKAIRKIKALIEGNPSWAVHFPIEVRFSKEEDIWLSPSYGRESCWIGIIMYRPWNFEPASFKDIYFLEFERIMIELGGRPHWAKAHRLNASDFRRIYPKFEDWLKIRSRLDKQKMFINPYLRATIL